MVAIKFENCILEIKSNIDFINLDLPGWEEAPEDKKMKVKE